jgi:hypothetical protein
MKNITVTVSDQAYRNARVWAAQRETSLSRIVQYLISTLPTMARATRAFPSPIPALPCPKHRLRQPLRPKRPRL